MLRRVCARLSPNFTPIFMPALSPSMETGKILEWNKKVGDEIQSGDLWCRLETDKAAVDFNNTSDEGFIAAIYAKEGDVVQVGKTIAVLVDEAEDVAKGGEYVVTDAPAEAPAAAATPAPAAPAPAAASSGVAASAGAVSKSGPAVARLAAQTPSDKLADLTATGKDGRLTKADFLAVGSIDYENAKALPKPPVERPTFDGAAAAPAAAATSSSSVSGVFNPGKVANFNVRDDKLLAKLIGLKAKKAPKKVVEAVA